MDVPRAGRRPRPVPRRGTPARWASAAAAAAIAAVAALAATAGAHSSLTVPTGISFTKDCRIGGPPGFKRSCPGPCPNALLRTRGRGSSRVKPALKVQRGQALPVVWARNNHEGGFVRWSLVGVDDMWSWDAHATAAFHWGCFSAGRFRCTAAAPDACVDDARREAYSDTLRIPAIYPDGDYVLSWAWYGGVRFDSLAHRPVSSVSGDYFDCSYVRITGGAPLVRSHQPTFSPGRFTAAPGACVSAVNRLGPCRHEPCTVGGSLYAPSLFTGGVTVPSEFAHGRRPRPLTTAMFNGVLGKGGAQRQPQGPPYIAGAYIVNRFGSRVRTLLGAAEGVNTLTLSPEGVDVFTVEAVLGGKTPRSVKFEVEGWVARIDWAAPWGLTREAPDGGWEPWGGWTSGKELKLRITPEGGGGGVYRLKVFLPR